jgi:flagellar export protein FliJ
MAKFRLQPVLKLRKHREEARKRELAVALGEENRRKELALRLARLRQEQLQEVRRAQQAGTLDIRSLIELKAYVGLLDRRIVEQLGLVAEAERETAARREVLVAAMKDRKALEVLERRHVERLRGEEARRETAELDEVGARMHSPAAAARV